MIKVLVNCVSGEISLPGCRFHAIFSHDLSSNVCECGEGRNMYIQSTVLLLLQIIQKLVASVGMLQTIFFRKQALK